MSKYLSTEHKGSPEHAIAIAARQSLEETFITDELIDDIVKAFWRWDYVRASKAIASKNRWTDSL